MPGPLKANLEMVALDAFPVREPVSKRGYTIFRLGTRAGIKGYGECSRLSGADLATIRRAIRGKEASGFETIPRGLRISAAALAGLEMAMLDVAGKFAGVPVYRMLGGPTRNRVRALAYITGESDDAVVSAVTQARANGHRSFLIPTSRSQTIRDGVDLVAATRQRLDAVCCAAGDRADFVLDAGGRLTPDEAFSLSAALEREHLLWFDEPCRPSDLSAAYRMAAETVTPVGIGRFFVEPGVFRDLLRSDGIDVIRADIALHGITRLRRLAALAETYFVSMAPFHAGGPIATAAALNLAATLPNFSIQQLPISVAPRDRFMRAALAGESLEVVKDGFLELPSEPGLGIQVNESALAEYGAEDE